MYEQNPLRAEFDYDQMQNRLNRINGQPTANKWSRGSMLFFGQVNMKTGLYPHLRDLGIILFTFLQNLHK